MSNQRAAELGSIDEHPTLVGNGRVPEVSRRRADHEVDFFETLAVLRRHLRPIFRYLAGQAGRLWREVAAEVDRRCRAARCPAAVRGRLRAAVLRQVGLGGKNGPTALLPRPAVVVDADTGRLRRVAG